MRAEVSSACSCRIVESDYFGGPELWMLTSIDRLLQCITELHLVIPSGSGHAGRKLRLILAEVE